MKQRGYTMKRMIISVFMGLILTGALWAQAPDPDSAAVPDTALTAPDQVGGTETGERRQSVTGTQIFRDLAKFRIPLLGTLFVGLLLGIYQGYVLTSETRRAKPLVKTAFGRMSTPELERELQSQAGRSRLGKLLWLLLQLHREDTQNDDDYHNEINLTAKERQEGFQTFRNWMTFLADAAGALGLLGTVVGIYMTFYGGSLDPAKILNGMGVALSTTLVGLVISLILNLVATSLSHMFDRQIEVSYRKAEELRFALKAREARLNLGAAAGSHP
ncbi:MAG: MotA/TolQ/ExbB proton channel family protein [Candidatus Zixiibacteriota bacterium]|nr:MAG: MotA/TolQ/ExbB proton channel family protein [candidate division Zixibacteria bacterium]